MREKEYMDTFQGQSTGAGSRGARTRRRGRGGRAKLSKNFKFVQIHLNKIIG